MKRKVYAAGHYSMALCLLAIVAGIFQWSTARPGDDALSTAVFVLGSKSGLRLLRQFPGAEGVVVDDENRVHITKGLRDKILVSPPTP